MHGDGKAYKLKSQSQPKKGPDGITVRLDMGGKQNLFATAYPFSNLF
jgi:hypothetical protein